MAADGAQMGGFSGPDQWPWYWHRLIIYVRKVRSVYERVSLDPEPETAVPSRWMFWDDDELDEWFSTRRETLKQPTYDVGDERHGNLRR